MTHRLLVLLPLLFAAISPNHASAQVHASLRADAGAGPYRQVLELVSDGESADVVFDRRLLRLSVHVEGRRRPLRCLHPAAPTRVVEARIVHLDSSHPRVGEWLDLRMYCTGRALQALMAGGRVEARYGFRRVSRRRWVVRTPDARPTAELSLDDFSLPVVNAAAAPPTEVRVRLASGSVRQGRSPRFRLNLRSTSGARIVYLRDDLYRFRVHGPLGDVECGPQRRPVNPIVDFYQRISPRRSRTARVDGQTACPGAFSVAGVYEITPILDLIYDGARYGLDVTTGSFEGAPALLRVIGRGYVEHPLGDSGAP